MGAYTSNDKKQFAAAITPVYEALPFPTRMVGAPDRRRPQAVGGRSRLRLGVHDHQPPFDLWSLQGFVPPPFDSRAEKRWISENKASAYTQAEKLPVKLALAPGTTGDSW